MAFLQSGDRISILQLDNRVAILQCQEIESQCRNTRNSLSYRPVRSPPIRLQSRRRSSKSAHTATSARSIARKSNRGYPGIATHRIASILESARQSDVEYSGIARQSSSEYPGVMRQSNERSGVATHRIATLSAGKNKNRLTATLEFCCT